MDVTYVIIAWAPVATMFFTLFPPVRALILAYAVGWLALPMVTIPVEGFWDIDKILTTNIGVLLGTVLFCPRALRGYRLHRADVGLLVFAAAAFVTSLTNDLGVYDGVSSFTHAILYYACPFWFGRVFIRTKRDLLEAGRLIVYAASVYALLAMWEWRMSPQIHETLYGFFHHSWRQHARWGFWRPIVCFPHALALGIFFAWTSLLAIRLYHAGELRTLLSAPPVVFVILPLMGLLTSMSMGPWGLFLIGLVLLLYRRHRAWQRLVCLPAVFALCWMVARYTTVSDGRWLLSAVAAVSEDRADSLEYRIDAETQYIEHAKQRPAFGWGSWGRNRVVDRHGRWIAVDGLWVILISAHGIVGLVSFYLWWCSPLLIAARTGASTNKNPAREALLLAVGLQAMNLIFNGFLSPVLTLMNGAVVTSFLVTGRQAPPRRRAAARSERTPRQRTCAPLGS